MPRPPSATSPADETYERRRGGGNLQPRSLRMQLEWEELSQRVRSAKPERRICTQRTPHSSVSESGVGREWRCTEHTGAALRLLSSLRHSAIRRVAQCDEFTAEDESTGREREWQSAVRSAAEGVAMSEGRRTIHPQCSLGGAGLRRPRCLIPGGDRGWRNRSSPPRISIAVQSAASLTSLCASPHCSPGPPAQHHCSHCCCGRSDSRR